MSRVIIKRPRVYEDLVELGDYIAKDSLRAAVRFAEAFDETLERLGEMPGLGSPCEFPHPAFPELLYWPIKGFPRHLILFRPVSRGIEVLRICHATQDLEALFRT